MTGEPSAFTAHGGVVWPQVGPNLRMKLLKIAAEVRLTARRMWVRYSCAYPRQNVFAAAYTALRC